MSEQCNDNSDSQSEMHQIPASAITVGARFSDDVYFNDGENMFIAAGKEVKPYHEEALARWKVSALLTRGHRLESDDES